MVDIVHVRSPYVLAGHIENCFQHNPKVFGNGWPRPLPYLLRIAVASAMADDKQKYHELLLKGYCPWRSESTCLLHYGGKPNETVSSHARSIEYALLMSMQELCHSVIFGQYTVISDYPLSLPNLLVKHTKKDPPKRYLVQIICIPWLTRIHYEPSSTHQQSNTLVSISK